MNTLRKILSLNYIRVIFLLCVAVWFCFWVFHITVIPSSPLGAPDEGLRYLVPKFIFENWQLPTGYDTATIHTMGNWSYAFYPQFLSPLISACFMFVGSLFSDTPESLIYAARMASVLFGVLAVLFVGLSVEKIFKTNKNAQIYGYIAMVIVAGWPQVAFLSAYINNDIVGFCGVSIILYACIAGYKDGWNIKNSLILAAGFVVCLLGYINSYGFVLFGGVFFVLSLWWQSVSNMHFLKLICVVLLSTGLLAGPFFLRNAIIYKGDVFGLATFGERTEEWESKTKLQAQRSYSERTGKELGDLIVDKDYRKTQIESAIARFGKMTIAPDESYAGLYRHAIQIGLLGFISMIVVGTIRHIRKKGMTKSKFRLVVGSYKREILFTACMIGACMTTIALSLYYSLTIDYQAQGRYIISLLIPFTIASIVGFRFLVSELIKKNARVFIVALFIGYYIFTSLIIYYKYVYWVRVP